MWWLEMHRPDLLTDIGKNRLTDLVPRHVVEDLRGMKKGEFFDLFLRARALNGMD